MALGNLVLSRQDSLQLDVRSTVPVEEVARLRYGSLPTSAGIFPTPLLETALVKMRAASNDALVQKILHPPWIPRKPSSAQSKAASSSAAPADCGGATPWCPGCSRPLRRPLLLRPQTRAVSRRGARVRVPFPMPRGSYCGSCREGQSISSRSCAFGS